MRTYGEFGGEHQLARYFSLSSSRADLCGHAEQIFLSLFRDEPCRLLFQRLGAEGSFNQLIQLAVKSRNAYSEVLFTLLVYPYLCVSLLRFIRIFSPDIILMHGVQAGLLAIPVRVVFPNAKLIYFHRIEKRRRFSIFFRVIYSPFHLLAGNSASVVKSLITIEPRKPVVLIHNGVSPEFFSIEASRINTRVDGQCRFVAVGRLVPRKSYHRLIKIFLQFDRSWPGIASLDILGDGPEGPSLQSYVASEGAETFIRFRGHVGDVSATLGQYQAFIHLSEREGSSNAVLEAMAASLPSVVLDSAGVSELHIKNETAFVCGCDADVLLAIKRLCESESLRIRMGDRSRAHAMASYSMESNLVAYNDMFSRFYTTEQGNAEQV